MIVIGADLFAIDDNPVAPRRQRRPAPVIGMDTARIYLREDIAAFAVAQLRRDLGRDEGGVEMVAGRMADTGIGRCFIAP